MYHLVAKIYNTAFVVMIICLAVLFSVRVSAAENEMVKIGYSGIPEELFQTYILIEGLEALGYHVPDPVSLDLSTLYEDIEAGKIDLTAGFWDPLQRPFLQKKKNRNAVMLGAYIEGAKSGYLINKAIAEKYHITSLSDFAKPEIAKLFDHNGNQKADLTGCELGWGCSKMIKKHLKKLQLEDNIEYIAGHFFAQISEVVAKYDSDQPVLFYSWTPMWVTGLLQPNRDVIWLDAEDVKGFGENNIKFLASQSFLKNHADIHYILEHLSIPLQDVANQNFMMQKGEDSLRQIRSHARSWVQDNKKDFEAIIKEAQKL